MWLNLRRASKLMELVLDEGVDVGWAERLSPFEVFELHQRQALEHLASTLRMC